MATEVLEDTACKVYFRPDFRPSAATTAFYKPGSTTALLSGAAQIGPDASAAGPWCVDVVTSQRQITLDSSNPFSPETQASRWAWLKSQDEWGAPVRISEKTSSFQLLLAAEPPGSIQVNDDLYNLALVFDLTAAATADRDMNYKLEWTITNADTAEITKHRTIVHVVRTQFRSACTAEEVQRYIASAYPSYATGLDFGYLQAIAERASARVRLRVQSAGAYPHLIGDPDVFRTGDVGIHSLRVELASEGLVPAGYDPSQYREDSDRALSRSVHDTLRALQWVDTDDDGVVDAPEVRKTYTVRAVRE